MTSSYKKQVASYKQNQKRDQHYIFYGGGISAIKTAKIANSKREKIRKILQIQSAICVGNVVTVVNVGDVNFV